MSTWSGTRKKLEEDYLCPALRGRVRYFATTYSKCPDHEGRAAILVDGVEVLKSSYYEYAPAFWKLQSELRRLEEADWREASMPPFRSSTTRVSRPAWPVRTPSSAFSPCWTAGWASGGWRR